MARVIEQDREAELAALVIHHGRTMPARVAAVLAAGASILAAVIHGLVVPAHMMGYAHGEVPGWLPLAFAVSAALGLVWSATLLAGLSRVWLGFGIALNATLAAAGLISRTVGLPGAGIEDPTGAWSAATFAEGLALVLSVVLVSWGLAATWRPRPARLAVVLAGMLAVSIVAGLALVGSAEVVEHGKMLAGWIWLFPDGWMW
jgi:hypothetical protein